MTAELIYAISARYEKDGTPVMIPGEPVVVDVAGNAVVDATINLDTNYEYLPLGDVAIGGRIFMENLGTTEIWIREDLTGNPRHRLQPGERDTFRPDPTGFATPAARAATGTSRLRFIVFSN